MFVRSLSLLAATALTVAAFTFSPTVADAVTADAVVHKAGHGFAYDLGSKHMVGVFQSGSGTCTLTVVLTNRAANDGVDNDGVDGTGTALTMAVAAGQATRVDSGEGAGLSIVCDADATSMTVTTTGRGA